MLEKINLSVHQLVDFLLRKGDIDDRLFNNKTMEEGSEIHRKFQKKQKANYFSEVDLKTTIVFENYEINLHEISRFGRYTTGCIYVCTFYR